MTDEDLVGALLDIEEGLSEWELSFTESIDKWFEQYGYLTVGQRKKAEQIWEDRG